MKDVDRRRDDDDQENGANGEGKGNAILCGIIRC